MAKILLSALCTVLFFVPQKAVSAETIYKLGRVHISFPMECSKALEQALRTRVLPELNRTLESLGRVTSASYLEIFLSEEPRFELSGDGAKRWLTMDSSIRLNHGVALRYRARVSAHQLESVGQTDLKSANALAEAMLAAFSDFAVYHQIFDSKRNFKAALDRTEKILQIFKLVLSEEEYLDLEKSWRAVHQFSRPLTDAVESFWMIPRVNLFAKFLEKLHTFQDRLGLRPGSHILDEEIIGANNLNPFLEARSEVAASILQDLGRLEFEYLFKGALSLIEGQGGRLSVSAILSEAGASTSKPGEVRLWRLLINLDARLRGAPGASRAVMVEFAAAGSADEALYSHAWREPLLAKLRGDKGVANELAWSLYQAWTKQLAANTGEANPTSLPSAAEGPGMVLSQQSATNVVEVHLADRTAEVAKSAPEVLNAPVIQSTSIADAQIVTPVAVMDVAGFDFCDGVFDTQVYPEAVEFDGAAELPRVIIPAEVTSAVKLSPVKPDSRASMAALAEFEKMHQKLASPARQLRAIELSTRTYSVKPRAPKPSTP